MDQKLVLSIVLLSIVLLAQQSEAIPRQRLLPRQTSDREAESTTSASTASGSQGQGSGNGNANNLNPPRLYPDLPQQPAFVPLFGVQNARNANGQGFFVPFGMNRNQMQQQQPPLMAPDWPPMMNGGRPMNMPRPMSAAERQQSRIFVDGLGSKLLAMIGIHSPPPTTNETATSREAMASPASHNMAEGAMMALQNSTVLQQLNQGVHSVYGRLSRMYNSTVQQQLNLLQERLLGNSTDPRQQQMAQQVPQFFKAMAQRVSEAQENLNRVWRQMTAAGNNTTNGMLTATNRVASPRSANILESDGPMDGDFMPIFGVNNQQPGGSFFNQIGRSFGLGDMNGQGAEGMDFGSQLMSFWHNQVMPQIGMVRGQVARVWRDLMQSGAFRPQESMMFSSRSRQPTAASSGNRSSSPDIVDDVLKDVEIKDPELRLVDFGAGNDGGNRQSGLGGQMQNGLVNMQRELNQLWNGLTMSLQNAIRNMGGRRSPTVTGTTRQDSSADKIEVDATENEISDKITGLGKLQREADMVYDAVQRQQQQQQEQQRPSFTDRFRSFFNNMDLGDNMDRFRNRLGNSMSRFETVVGDLWHQIPERWDNFMRPQDLASVTNAQLQANGGASTTSGSTTPMPRSSSMATVIR